MLVIVIVGVKRPPALLCTEEDSMDLLLSYEIALTEPLHDFKNVINRVLDELPYATSDKHIRASLLDILNELKSRCTLK